MKKVIIDNYIFERKLHDEGYTLIAGVDEVGRGPLAGPVAATAIIMPKDCYIEGVTDSKKVSPKKRKELKNQILEKAIAVSTIFINEKIIDEVNIYEATKLAMYQAINELDPKPDYVLIDAMPLDLDIPHESIIKGDEKSFTIACASIIAKEARDELMDEFDQKYPEYDFKQNKGYPTKKHRNALLTYGVTPIHRRTYGPVKVAIQKQIVNKYEN
ncbi:MAG: ribonuclease HII [Bacilli bacterium]|nr:ribonuclease HII [Mollicutes bacterium]MDY3899658.1 ribonuclease HII [Bacilli bacterium]